MRLRRFNEAGCRAFEAYLLRLKSGAQEEPSRALLEDPECTQVVCAGTEVGEESFATRLEAARSLDVLLRSAFDKSPERDQGLWAWLSLRYFDCVCPPSPKSGVRRPGELARHIPSIEWTKRFRHLLLGAWLVYQAHRDDPKRAMVLLCNPVHRPGEIVEQLVNKVDVLRNAHAVAVATAIYFDRETDTFRRGAAGSGPGSARRYASVLGQFDVTWDLMSMEPRRIVELLPDEFSRFARYAEGVL